MTPVETLLAWYTELAPELRMQLAMEVKHCAPPGLVAAEDEDTLSERRAALPKRIETALQNWAARKVSAHLGAVLFMSAVVDFTMLRHGDSASWDEAREDMATIAASDAEFAQHATTTTMEMPLRERRWLKAANDWRELRANALSAQELERWHRAALFAELQLPHVPH